MKQYHQMNRAELLQELARHQKLLAGASAENPRNTWLKLFIYLAPVSIAMFDRDMRYISASRRWGEAYHVGDQDLTGRSHYEMFPEIGEEWKDAHRRGLAGEVLRAACDRFDRLDGSVQWIRWEIQPWYEASDTVGGIVIFAEDVSELKEAQRGWASVSPLPKESSSVMVVPSGPRGKWARARLSFSPCRAPEITRDAANAREKSPPCTAF
jgi:PAS domain S-box-containing protein